MKHKLHETVDNEISGTQTYARCFIGATKILRLNQRLLRGITLALPRSVRTVRADTTGHMPNRDVHDVAGLLAGAVAATVKAKDTQGLPALMEVLGGAWGGVKGARAPDLLEPATCPQHRCFAHSWTVFLAVIGTSVDAARALCQKMGEHCDERAQDLTLAPLHRFLYALGALFWWFCAGALTGFKAGYASHLALDGCTPMGLPLIGIR